MSYEFESFVVDTEKYILSENGVELKIEPLVFDLICALLARASTVVTKDELLASVWRGRIVSDTTISSAIKSARKVLGDSGSTQKFIKTVHGRGFSFVLDEVQSVSSRAPDESIDFISPTIMVLVGLDENRGDSANIAPRMEKDLERIFSRIPLLKVNSEAQRVKNLREELSPRQIYELVTCDYLIEVQLSDAQETKCYAQLIDAKGGLLLWSHTYSYTAPLSEKVVDRCIVDIVNLFEPQITKAVYQSVRSPRRGESAEAKFIEAAGVLALKGWHESSFREASKLLRESMRLAPQFPLAPAYLSLILAFGHRIGVFTDQEAAKAEALNLTEKALDIESHDSTILGFCGCALVDVGFTDRGISVLNKSLGLNPENSQALVARGAAWLTKFELAQSIEDMENGIALSPLDSRLAVWRSVLAIAYILDKNVAAAYEHAILGCQEDHRTYLPRIALAGAEWAKGNVKEAQSAIIEAKSINPSLSEIQIQALLGKALGEKVSALLD